jgi:hypothetical protein
MNFYNPNKIRKVHMVEIRNEIYYGGIKEETPIKHGYGL